MLIRSRPDRGENSTAYTTPSYEARRHLQQYERRRNENTHGTHDICDMAHTRTARGTQIQDLLPRRNENIIHPTQHTRRQLTPERVPHPILYLGIPHRTFDRNPFLSIHALPWNEVFGDQQVILAFGDENPRVSVRLKDDFGSPSCATATATAITSTCASTAAATTWSTSAVYTTTYVANEIQDTGRRTLRNAPRLPRPPPLGAPRPAPPPRPPPPLPPNPPRLPDAPNIRCNAW